MLSQVSLTLIDQNGERHGRRGDLASGSPGMDVRKALELKVLSGKYKLIVLLKNVLENGVYLLLLFVTFFALKQPKLLTPLAGLMICYF